jgi:hypothetical protein
MSMGAAGMVRQGGHYLLKFAKARPDFLCDVAN